MIINCGVYKIKNLNNGNCYIGSSSNLKSRKYQHFNELEKDKHGNPHLQNSYNINGKDNFQWSMLKCIERIENKEKLKEELLKWEQYYIDDYKSKGIKLYNIRDRADSNLGVKFSEETKKKISESHKGKVVSKETKKKQSEIASNRTEEHKDKIRKLRLGSKASKETKKKMSKSHKDFTHTKESKVLMSKNSKHIPSYGHAGKTHSEETKEKIKIAKLGSKHSEETKIKMSNSNKKATTKEVINLDTKKFFNSLTEASKFYNINISHISAVCKGKRKTAGKYRWSYVSSLYSIENLKPISVEGAIKLMLSRGMSIGGISIITGLMNKMEKD